MIHARSLFLTLVLLAVACAPPEREPVREREPARETAAAAPVRTDRAHYRMEEGPFGPEVSIVATYRPPGDRPVYIVNCNGAISVGLQELVDGAWVHAWAVEMNACLSEPVVLQPGESRTERIVAASGAHAAVESRRNSSRIDGGTYRVVFHGVYLSFDPLARPWGEEVPLAERASAPFRIDPPTERNPELSSPRERPSEIDVGPAHGATVAPETPIRITFDRSRIATIGDPQLFIDGAWVESPRASRTDASLVLEHRARGLGAGRHEARVVYRDVDGATRWYAWSFVIDSE